MKKEQKNFLISVLMVALKNKWNVKMRNGKYIFYKMR